MAGPWEDDPYLPADVRPLNYDISVRFNLSGRSFTGITKINISVTMKKQSLWFHRRDLDVNTVELKNSVGEGVAIRATFISKNNVFLVITAEQELPVGLYQVELWYDGEFNTLDVYTEFFYYYEESPNVLR